MSISFDKPGERAKYYKESLALAEVMASFVRHLDLAQKNAAIGKVRDIHLFLQISGLQEATIEKGNWNHYGADLAKQMLSARQFPFQVSANSLEELWTEITNDWWSSDHWLGLKMLISIRCGVRSQELNIYLYN